MEHATEEASPVPIQKAQFQLGRLLREINRRITSGDDSKSILDFIFDSLDSIIPYDRIGIALIDAQGEERKLCSKWMRSKTPSSHLGIGYCGPLDGSSLECILSSGHPRIINNLVQYGLEKPQSESTKLALRDGIRSSLTCPVYLHKKPIGIVFFSSGKFDTYKSEHIETYLEIADELSFVIDQDRIRNEAASITSAKQNVRMLLHDLKSPLSVIQGFLQLAQDEDWYGTLDQEAKKIFTTLGRNASRMSNLLTELAELNQLNFQSDKTDIHEVHLMKFISEIEGAARDLASKKNIGFTLKLDQALPEQPFFDAAKIRRVMENLISNAVKYSARGTNILFSVHGEQGRIHFAVSDQGQGIPQDELPKLFREFGKTSVRPTEGESSSGIGLAIAKKIVEQHGGEISVKSQVGQGSTFLFWIPADGK